MSIMSKCCFEIIQECALHAGSDLNEPLPAELRQHLACCPGCRESFHQLRKDVALLQKCESEVDREQDRSCWSSLSHRLKTRRARKRSRDHASGWIAAVSMSVACMALFAIPMLEQQQPTNPAAMRGVMSELPNELLFRSEPEPEMNPEFRTLEYRFDADVPRLLDSYHPEDDNSVKAKRDLTDGQFSPRE